MGFKKPCDISNLMSPPEPAPFDTFNQAALPNSMQPSAAEKPFIHPPLSPPVSPVSKPSNSVSPAPSLCIVVHDPILYPRAQNAASPPAPLFSPATVGSIETTRLVDEHIASRPAGLFREASPPKREDYELALYFQSNVMRMFQDNPRGWLRRERELLRADRKNTTAVRHVPRLATILPAARPTSAAAADAAAAVLKPQPTTISRSRVQKTRAPKANKTQNPRPIRATPAPLRHTIRVSTTPEPRVRTVAPNREDKDFNSLVDLCPPLSSLPNKPHSLKVDWKGNSLDLSNDVHAHLLHPDEVALAACLRLDCATYLTSKRRIFIKRLECAKIGKEFRKTDAQQACKIDVNKASKLWTAYDKVGWLDLHWIKPYLSQ
ncbi:hypothetical protein QBC46DRAFT_267168 [Diplogelasinospora grovesii]|uniref:SWIRM domain-containing protein n=1 Tax=Diplogelasinospora grovesii TaxID=303347 RepID=A0AAN6S2M3_9PEZI|nr:hypothetical protein QBC46DRAFT_267168 [Diplogelasinospora grovesii]